MSAGQILRRVQNTTAYEKIQRLLEKLEEIIDDCDDEYESEGKKDIKEKKPFTPFTIKLDDPAGNSFVEFHGSMSDPKWNSRQYKRSREQDIALGLVAPADGNETNRVSAPSDALSKDPLALADEMEAAEVLIFPGACPSCRLPLDTRMKKVTIPYFKVILVSERPDLKQIFTYCLVGHFVDVYQLRTVWV